MSSTPDPFLHAHLQRLLALQARMQSLSEKQLVQHLQAFIAFDQAEQQRFPAAWALPCDRWQSPEQRTAWFNTPEGMAWQHSTYVLQGACLRQVVEANREIEHRASSSRNTSILKRSTDRTIL